MWVVIRRAKPCQLHHSGSLCQLVQVNKEVTLGEILLFSAELGALFFFGSF